MQYLKKIFLIATYEYNFKSQYLNSVDNFNNLFRICIVNYVGTPGIDYKTIEPIAYTYAYKV